MTHPADASELVVLVGMDKALVQTRRWILEKAGFRLRTPSNIVELNRLTADERISLFVLCDSLSQEARQDALATMHSRWPAARRLVLMPSSIFSEFDPPEEVFPAMEGPGKLVATVRRLIANGPATVS